MVPSLTAVDRAGRPVAPGLLYGDRRGHTDAAALGPGGDGSTVKLAAWLAAFAPGAAGYWPATAVANRALGADAAIDYGVAFTASPLYGPEGWDPKVAASCGLTVGQLPRVVEPGARLGRVGPRHDGPVLAAGSVDGLCEQLMAGATAPGDVHVICGTTLIVWTVVPSFTEHPGLWTIPHPDMTTIVAGGASNAGGLFLDWVGRLWPRRRRQDRADPANLP